MLTRTLATTAFLILSATSANAAGVYKCTDPATGKLTISQFQCDPDAAPVEVQTVRPTEAQIQETMAREAAAVDQVQAIINAKRDLRAMAARQKRIDELAAQRDAEIARNRRRSAFSTNNLAGATYRGALATESQTAAQNYNAQIEAEREALYRTLDR